MLHASALRTSHYRNMLRPLETKPDIENMRGSPYGSKTVFHSRRLVVQNHPDVSGLIKNVTVLHSQLLMGLLFISVSYQSIVNILSRVRLRRERKLDYFHQWQSKQCKVFLSKRVNVPVLSSFFKPLTMSVILNTKITNSKMTVYSKKFC